MQYYPFVKGSALETAIRIGGESWKRIVLELDPMILEDLYALRRLCHILGMDKTKFVVHLTREDYSQLCTGQPLNFKAETIYDFKIASISANKTRVEIC